jgi:sugar phosphate isomerase/epimerase
MSELLVGAQLYTVREYSRTPAEIAETLARVRKIGYRAVQVSGIGKIEPAELRRILDGEGLRAVATHTALDRLVDETQAVLDEHRTLGADYCACPGLPVEMHNPDGYRKAAADLSRAGEFFSRHGLRLGYHNHAVELIRYDGRTGLEILLDESDRRYLEAEIDTYWVAYAGGDPSAWCRRYAGRLTAVHLKDMTYKSGVKQVMTEVGEGNLNWPGILDACRAAGTRYYLVEQDVCERDPFESLRISLENLRRMGLEDEA